MPLYACRLAEWAVLLQTAITAIAMLRVRNPARTAASALGKERYINKWLTKSASHAMQVALRK